MAEVNPKSLPLKSNIVEIDIEKVRLSDYAFKVFHEFLPSKKSVKKALKQKRIKLNGSTGYSGDFVSQGMKIELLPDLSKPTKVFELQLPVLYEDDYLAVINKPAGYPVNGNYFKTIQNALTYNLRIGTTKDALPSPLPCHRLDTMTSGCLIIAKTKTAQINLGNQFESRQINKTYKAIVVGQTPIKGILQLNIAYQEAITLFETEASFSSLTYGKISLIKLYPQTGRTHQLRIHCADIGHPIIGDKLYTKEEKLLKGKGLFLNANQISFLHPETKEMINIQISLPPKFEAYINREQCRFHKFNKNEV